MKPRKERKPTLCLSLSLSCSPVIIAIPPAIFRVSSGHFLRCRIVSYYHQVLIIFSPSSPSPSQWSSLTMSRNMLLLLLLLPGMLELFCLPDGPPPRAHGLPTPPVTSSKSHTGQTSSWKDVEFQQDNMTSWEVIPDPHLKDRIFNTTVTRRKLGSFQICALCTCCGGRRRFCIPTACCYTITCGSRNRPFGFCSFMPVSCNCLHCRL